MRPRSTAVALLMRKSVAWQKRKDSSVQAFASVNFVKGLNSSMIPQSSMVLPLPGSPLIQSSRLCWSSRHRRNSALSRIQQYESCSRPPFVFSMRALSRRGSESRRSIRQGPSLSCTSDDSVIARNIGGGFSLPETDWLMTTFSWNIWFTA